MKGFDFRTVSDEDVLWRLKTSSTTAIGNASAGNLQPNSGMIVLHFVENAVILITISTYMEMRITKSQGELKKRNSGWILSQIQAVAVL